MFCGKRNNNKYIEKGLLKNVVSSQRGPTLQELEMIRFLQTE